MAAARWPVAAGAAAADAAAAAAKAQGRRRRRGGRGLLLLVCGAAALLAAGPSFVAQRTASAPAAAGPATATATAAAAAAGATRPSELRGTFAGGAAQAAPAASPRSRGSLGLLPVAGVLLGLAAAPRVARAAAAGGVAGAAPGLAAVLGEAGRRAFKGGIAGLLAGVLQVFTFMWLRTSMNYQYVKGGNLKMALSQLWAEGGLARLYQGWELAILQAPLSRFGDTAANAGMLALLAVYCPGMPVGMKTAMASVVGALWRIFLTPIDTFKTTRQVQGSKGTDMLWQRVRRNGFGELYAGCLANFAANWMGSYPYFAMYNLLSTAWLTPETATMRIVRNGIIGMASTITSDCVSNSLRVLKTLRQSSDSPKGYLGTASDIIKKDGVWGLFGRGLETRLLVNVLQGTFFSITWKLIEENFHR